nr:hypothetical protein [Shewanella sp.]
MSLGSPFLYLFFSVYYYRYYIYSLCCFFQDDLPVCAG